MLFTTVKLINTREGFFYSDSIPTDSLSDPIISTFLKKSQKLINIVIPSPKWDLLFYSGFSLVTGGGVGGGFGKKYCKTHFCLL